MASIIAALPVAPGKSERAACFHDELRAHWEQYTRLNQEATLTRHATWLQRSPAGDLLIHLMEVDDPMKLGREFTDSAYDRWWIEWCQDVHAFDIREVAANAQPPDELLDWRARD